MRNLLTKNISWQLVKLLSFVQIYPILLCKSLFRFIPCISSKPLINTFSAGMKSFSMLTEMYDKCDISLLYFLDKLSLILMFFHVFKEYFKKELLCQILIILFQSWKKNNGKLSTCDFSNQPAQIPAEHMESNATTENRFSLYLLILALVSELTLQVAHQPTLVVHTRLLTKTAQSKALPQRMR